jgi:hypothetical protein
MHILSWNSIYGLKPFSNGCKRLMLNESRKWDVRTQQIFERKRSSKITPEWFEILTFDSTIDFTGI